MIVALLHLVLTMPVVSPEMAFDQPVFTAFPSGSQGQPVAAYDGNNYLVVWSDSRRAGSPFPPGDDIFGARLSPSGALLDPNGLQIRIGGTNTRGEPDVAFNGTSYLVVWVESDPSTNATSVVATRIDPSGVVLDENGFPVATGQYDYFSPHVAALGGLFLVVWTQMNCSGAYFTSATRVSGSGQVLDTNGLAVWNGDGVGVGSGSNDFLLAWAHNGVIATRIDLTGKILDMPNIVLGTSSEVVGDPAVTWNGTDYFVAWENYVTNPLSEIEGARVSPTGTLVDATPITISSGYYPGPPRASSDGTNFFTTWVYGTNYPSAEGVFGARVSPSGTVLDPNGFAIDSDTTAQALAVPVFGNTNFLVVFELWAGQMNVFGRRVSSGGTLLDTTSIQVATGANSELSPAVGFQGQNYLGIWIDDRPGGGIFCAQLAPDGGMLDPTAVLVAPAPAQGQTPSMICSGGECMAVWADSSNSTRFARISNSAVVQDPGGVSLAAGTRYIMNPVVTSDGTNFGVAYTDANGVWLSLIDGNGNVLSRTSATPSLLVGQGAVASNGTNYLLTWFDSNTAVGYGARFSGSGIALDSAPFEIFSTLVNGVPLAAGSDGQDYLVGWYEQSLPTKAVSLFLARISAAGVVLDPGGVAVATGSLTSLSPAIAFDGTQYLVSWLGPAGQLGAYFRPQETLGTPSAFPIPGGGENLVSDGSGRTLVVYARFDDAAPFWSTRTRGRFVTVSDGGSDAGTSEPVDSGPPSDSGAVVDSGSGADANSMGLGVDGGKPSDAGANSHVSGCGCASTRAAPMVVYLLLLAALAGRRRSYNQT
jgi:MYXO-CTERM domain-containing protein